MQVIYTETTSCRDCYKCVRVCPVKAIHVKDGHAVIIKERCIYCGKCVNICPSKAKKVRNDISRAKLLISSGEQVFCSLAPSYISEFLGQTQQLLTAIKKLGFSDISETAIGASWVSNAIDKHVIENGKCSWISTACPSVVELVKKYYPEATGLLAKVPSPLQTHSAYLKKLYGDNIKIVFIGPCIAKKTEVDLTPGYPDVALTFEELRTWMSKEDINLDEIIPDDSIDFVPSRASSGTYYHVERGQIIASQIWGKKSFCQDALALSGVDELLDVLAQANKDQPFLELLGCEGGCLNGPASSKNKSLAIRKNVSAKFTESRIADADAFKGDDEFEKELLAKGYGIVNASEIVPEADFVKHFSEDEIKEALSILGKNAIQDQLNCGGCGYNTCRDMAIAYLAGMAEVEMCVIRMRREAQNKADIILRTIPNPIVLVDKDLVIVDCNLMFLRQFSDMDEAVIDDEMVSLVKGMQLDSFVPFHDKFSDEFHTKKKNQYRLHYKDKFLRITFFAVEDKHTLGAMFEDITSPTVRRETVVKNAEEVIQKSLETVQQVASLLGENAAETEIMLNSLIESFSVSGGENEFTVEKDSDIRWTISL